MCMWLCAPLNHSLTSGQRMWRGRLQGLLFISFYQQETRKMISYYITALLFLTIFALKNLGPAGPAGSFFFFRLRWAISAGNASRLSTGSTFLMAHSKMDSQWCNRLMGERTFPNHFLYWRGLAAVLGWHLLSLLFGPRIERVCPSPGEINFILSAWFVTSVFFSPLSKSCFN